MSELNCVRSGIRRDYSIKERDDTCGEEHISTFLHTLQEAPNCLLVRMDES